MRTALVCAAVLPLGLASMSVAAQSVNPLVGVWKVAELVSPQGETNPTPQPTLYIFTARHYSHVSVTSKSPLPNYAGPNVTDYKAS